MDKFNKTVTINYDAMKNHKRLANHKSLFLFKFSYNYRMILNLFFHHY